MRLKIDSIHIQKEKYDGNEIVNSIQRFRAHKISISDFNANICTTKSKSGTI